MKYLYVTICQISYFKIEPLSIQTGYLIIEPYVTWIESDFITVGDLVLFKLPCIHLFWHLCESLSCHLPRNLTLLLLVEPLTVYLGHRSRLAAALEHGSGWGGVCIQAEIITSGRCLLATSKSRFHVFRWVEFIIVLLVHHNPL